MTLAALATLFATALLFGGMATFSALFAPLVFTQLPPAQAGRFIRAVFPWYYLFVLVVAALAAVAALPVDLRVSGTMMVVALAGVYARQWLMPRINALRDAQLAGDAAAARAFHVRHRLSVAINAGQLLAVAVCLVLIGLRSAGAEPANPTDELPPGHPPVLPQGHPPVLPKGHPPLPARGESVI